MNLPLLLIAQVLLLAGTAVLGRTATPWKERTSAFMTLLCLLPLMLFGAAWPSLYTVLALLALPALLGCVPILIWPDLLRRVPVRVYGLVAMSCAVTATAIQIWWIARSDP